MFRLTFTDNNSDVEIFKTVNTKQEAMNEAQHFVLKWKNKTVWIYAYTAKNWKNECVCRMRYYTDSDWKMSYITY
jgi:hypothetical protein